jgi:hypothetical protein
LGYNADAQETSGMMRKDFSDAFENRPSKATARFLIQQFNTTHEVVKEYVSVVERGETG